MKMEYSCRKLGIEDLELVMGMNRDFREGFVCRENALQFLVNPDNWLYAAVSEDRIIGFAYGYELRRLDNRGNMLYIHEVGVMERYQRQGVGYRMMSQLKSACREKGICKCFLFTCQNNAGANALYQKLGGAVSSESLGMDTNYYFVTK